MKEPAKIAKNNCDFPTLRQSGCTYVDKTAKLAISQIQRKKYAAPYRAAGKSVWAVALSFKSCGRKFAGGRAIAVK